MFAAALLATFALLAQELPDPKSSAAIGWLLAGLAALAVAANQILGFVLNMRKLRGIDTAADGRYATKAEHAALSADVAEVKGQVIAVSTTLGAELRAIHRSLGRIEGRLGTEPSSGN